nr:DUF3833 family protein [uncultured Rhodopila sp.]
MRLAIRMLCAAASLTACGGTTLHAPDAATPLFDPIVFFDGHTLSRGVVEDRSGAPTEWIVTDGRASVGTDNRLHLVQHLTYQDGKTMERTWIVWRTGPNRFNATADDMIGTAAGESDGGIFHWRWVLARSPGNPLMNVTMEQWMYGLGDGSALIRTTVSKFGFIVAEVAEQFSHPEAAVPPAPSACAIQAGGPHG